MWGCDKINHNMNDIFYFLGKEYDFVAPCVDSGKLQEFEFEKFPKWLPII